MPGRGKAKEQACQQRNTECKRKHQTVKMDFVHARSAGRNKHAKHIYAPVGEYKPKQAARERQNQAFGEHLPHKPRTSRSQRRSNGKFLFACGSARKQKICNVGTGNQKHECNGTEQDVIIKFSVGRKYSLYVGGK